MPTYMLRNIDRTSGRKGPAPRPKRHPLRWCLQLLKAYAGGGLARPSDTSD
jgi:hypothetical protein